MTALPARIGRYEVVSPLGQGAMGAVFRAHDPVIDRIVAVKLIHRALVEGPDGPGYVALLHGEARAAGRCLHPNIVGLFDVGMQDALPFLVMECVEGEDLAARLRRHGRLGPAEAGGIVLQVLDALAAAHRAGIIHRDIKPSNIILGGDGHAKVSDFGVSCFRSSEAARGGRAGTPAYMAPEQCAGAPVDERSDLFSVGVMLHELLAGERPFGGTDAEAIMQSIREDAPRALPAPAAMRAVLGRSLAKAPADRFPSAGSMAAALREAMNPAPGQGGTAGETRPLPRPSGAAPPVAEAGLRGLRELLTRHLGPIAGLLVQEAARSADSAEALCASLASRIEAVPAREEFSRAARGVLDRAGSASVPDQASAGPSEEEVERLRQALSRHLGPIAGLLVQREAAIGTSVPALWEAMAQHIDSVEERRAFLRLR